ncbi:type II secretion system F family protein [Elusimicrobiota bacterium]
MDKNQLLVAFIISVLVGIAVFLLVNYLLIIIGKLSYEKRFKEKTDSKQIKLKIKLAGIFLFLAEKIGEFIGKIKLKKLDFYCNNINNKLNVLGSEYKNINPYTFIGIQILMALGSIIVSALLLEIYDILILVIFSAVSSYLPILFIDEKVKLKHKAIFRQIPDVLDRLTLMVDAGLDFNNAFNKVLADEKGELIQEFLIVQQETKLGKSRIDALVNMASRINYTPLNTVINTITTSIKTGGSIASALKTLSDQFRTERSQLAEKLASQAPIKLMGPLILLIFPTIFIILFGPILLSFSR